MMVAVPVVKIARTTNVCPQPGVPMFVDSGGYVVQPAPAEPRGTRKLASTITPESANTQNDHMFSFGNAMSRAPIISGMQRLPKQPISPGVIAQKIMIRPCIVNVEL